MMVCWDDRRGNLGAELVYVYQLSDPMLWYDLHRSPAAEVGGQEEAHLERRLPGEQRQRQGPAA